MTPPLPVLADVEAAAARLRGIVRRTPLLESDALNELVGGRLLCKAECLQRTGSFKLRGAYNTISQLDGRPVVAYSSGNHAQGVAAAAKLLGVPATIVMPADAPAIKIANTRALGAEIRLYDRQREVREEIGAEIAQRTGAALVKPYDDPRIIAGQGTAGLEAAAQLREQGLGLDAALLPCGGGGLIAGCSIALAAAFPDAAIYAVEPEGFDDTGRSLAAGERLANAPGAQSMCDALLAPMPGELTFALHRRHLAGGLAVSDAEVAKAMAAAFLHLKLVVEPGGAVALAAVLSGRFEARGRTVLVMLSGGNVDPGLFAQVLQA
ncbi:MAG TPA: threonine/serine dehydratase [Geminicoccaceae bacterium]|nr:threonine/serine dehydratase [Geminicoccaceae bacterium]